MVVEPGTSFDVIFCTTQVILGPREAGGRGSLAVLSFLSSPAPLLGSTLSHDVSHNARGGEMQMVGESYPQLPLLGLIIIT